MKKKICQIACLCLLCVFLFAVTATGEGVSPPSVSARSAVLIEAESGRILYGRDAYARRGMASTTKIMTALVALEHCENLRKNVTVAPAAAGVEGSSVYLYAGETVTMETLLYALMLQSANDAAVAIAYEIAGGVENFAALMNEKAAALGLSDTHFTNPHGLDDENHYTTAYELALLSAAALNNESFRRIVSTVKVSIPLHDGTASRLLLNHNRLLRESEDIIGVKTGFTKKCGRTLVTAAERDGLRLICVTLDDGNDWRDHRALLDYGFALYERAPLAEPHVLSYTLPVCGGTEDSLTVSNHSSLSALLPREHGEITHVTELPRFLYAGVRAGDRVGTVRFYADGKEIGAAPLYADVDALALQRQSFWQRILSIFK